jgi:hypothetical protein
MPLRMATVHCMSSRPIGNAQQRGSCGCSLPIPGNQSEMRDGDKRTSCAHRMNGITFAISRRSQWSDAANRGSRAAILAAWPPKEVDAVVLLQCS